MQRGQVAFEMTASFTAPESGDVIDPEPPRDLHELPAPESLPRYSELMASQDPLPFPAEWALAEHGVDVRTINAPWSVTGPSADDGIRLWRRRTSNSALGCCSQGNVNLLYTYVD